ncbi:hypothetical protein [Agrococcus sp. SGAir0287]|uniref:hypothetical protein n=1 Tax=Agrococcus sp. SGAir0287 TaxID=2070347 RepID=UPI0010CD0852|nr:hypothetical protein [Agrococcus sp. SGAir0287]QCR20337.1 hypothetical protein C1N71_13540 [Agrococcus sp. SGAir0287]
MSTPPLPCAVRVEALRAGAFAGALLGVGLSLVNLAALVALVVLPLGLHTGLPVLPAPADGVPPSELAEAALPRLRTAAGVGAILLAIGVLVSAWMLSRHVPSPAPVVAAACVLTLLGVAATGIVTTAAVWPTLPILTGIGGMRWAIVLACALGLDGALVGALVHAWVVRRMRARRLRDDGDDGTVRAHAQTASR